MELTPAHIGILYLLSCVRVAVSHHTACTLVMDSKLTDYFTATTHLNELTCDGLINENRVFDETHYIITAKGEKRASDELFRIPDEAISAIKTVAENYINGRHDLRSVYTRITPIGDNAFYVVCGVKEMENPLFEVRLRTKNESLANQIAEKFRLESHEIQSATEDLLTS